MDNPKLKFLEDVSWDSALKLSNGKTVHGLEQLPMVIKFSDDEVFDSHVTADKNDFANWIRDVIGDAELADKLLPIKTKDEFLKFMEQAITDIKKYRAPEPVASPVQPTVSPLASTPVSQLDSKPENAQEIKPKELPSTEKPVVAEISKVVETPKSVVTDVEKTSEVKPLKVKPIESTPASPSLSPGISPSISSNINESKSNPDDKPKDGSKVISEGQSKSDAVSSEISSSTSAITDVSKTDASKIDIPKDTSNNPSASNTSPNQSPSVEEIFDFEEIFKVLITELDKDVLEWDTQTS